MPAIKYIFAALCLALAVAVFPGLAGAKPLRADPLFDAAERGNHDNAQKALMAGSSANIRGGGGSTALIVSARIGAGDVVELLLAHGAIVDLVDDEDNSALIHGAVNDHDDIFRALLDAGAAINHAN